MFIIQKIPVVFISSATQMLGAVIPQAVTMTIIGKKNVSDLSENIAMITIAGSHIFSGVYYKSCSAVTLRNTVKYSTAHIAIITNGATANAAFAILVILS